MLAKKKKITKRQIKEDKLVTTYVKLQEFYEEYQQKIFIGAAILAVLIVGLLLYNNKVKEDNSKAAAELSKVIPLYNAKAFQEAIDGKPENNIMGLKKIVEEYGSSEQGENAKIYLANSYYMIGDIENALKYYEDYGGSVATFKATSLAGIGACYEAMGNYGDAAEFYSKAAFVTKENPQIPNYLFRAGVNYFKTGQKKAAKKLFLMIKNEYKKSDYVAKAQNYLEMMS